VGRHVVVYRSSRVQEMYLIVDRERGLDPVPDELWARFGQPIGAFGFELTAERRLARADARAVLRAITEQGYYLQMPPATGHLPVSHGR
jgi:uncharacterized protein